MAQQVKREQRRRIMSEKKYKRGGAPFDNAIHKEVNEKMVPQCRWIEPRAAAARARRLHACAHR